MNYLDWIILVATIAFIVLYGTIRTRICEKTSWHIGRIAPAQRRMSDVDGAVLVHSIDVAMWRIDSTRRDAIHTYSRAEIFTLLADGRVQSQGLATFADEPRIAYDLPWPELLSRVGERSSMSSYTRG